MEVGQMSDANLGSVQERLDALHGTAKSPTRENPSSDQLIGVIKDLTTTVSQSLSQRVEQHEQIVDRVTRVETTMESMSDSVSTLCKLVRDGNGQPSLIQRVSKVETEVLGMIDDYTEMKGNVNQIVVAKALSRTQLIIGACGMFVTCCLAAASLFATLRG